MTELCNTLNARLKEVGFEYTFKTEAREIEGETVEACVLRHPLDPTLRIAAGLWESDVILFYFDYHEHFDLSSKSPQAVEEELFERILGILSDKVIAYVKRNPRTGATVIEGAFTIEGDNVSKFLPYTAYKKPIFPPNEKRIIGEKNTELSCWSLRRVGLSKKKKLIFTDLTQEDAGELEQRKEKVNAGLLKKGYKTFFELDTAYRDYLAFPVLRFKHPSDKEKVIDFSIVDDRAKLSFLLSCEDFEEPDIYFDVEGIIRYTDDIINNEIVTVCDDKDPSYNLYFFLGAKASYFSDFSEDELEYVKTLRYAVWNGEATDKMKP